MLRYPPLLYPGSSGNMSGNNRILLGYIYFQLQYFSFQVFNPDFSTLISVLKAAGLIDLLSQVLPEHITLTPPPSLVQ